MICELVHFSKELFCCRVSWTSFSPRRHTARIVSACSTSTAWSGARPLTPTARVSHENMVIRSKLTDEMSRFFDHTHTHIGTKKCAVQWYICIRMYVSIGMLRNVELFSYHQWQLT